MEFPQLEHQMPGRSLVPDPERDDFRVAEFHRGVVPDGDDATASGARALIHLPESRQNIGIGMKVRDREPFRLTPVTRQRIDPSYSVEPLSVCCTVPWPYERC